MSEEMQIHAEALVSSPAWEDFLKPLLLDQWKAQRDQSLHLLLAGDAETATVCAAKSSGIEEVVNAVLYLANEKRPMIFDCEPCLKLVPQSPQVPEGTEGWENGQH